MEQENLVFALTVAGFDGSAGAGFLADIKAMEFFGVYGQAVCTALTVQNENEFLAPKWVSFEQIEAQLDALAKVRKFKAIKIGLVESASVLSLIVKKLKVLFPDAFLIWDPIVASSSGFAFFETQEESEAILSLLPEFDLVTPNQNEFNFLGIGVAACRDELNVGKDFSLLLKGGHALGNESVDILFYKGERLRFSSPRVSGTGKHGTGCALSAAIAANVALGKELPEACEMAKIYMDKYLRSGDGNLAFVRR